MSLEFGKTDGVHVSWNGFHVYKTAHMRGAVCQPFANHIHGISLLDDCSSAPGITNQPGLESFLFLLEICSDSKENVANLGTTYSTPRLGVLDCMWACGAFH